MHRRRRASYFASTCGCAIRRERPTGASFASFEDYLSRHGRDWERYAYVKARPITACEHYAEIYASAVRPFVYRRYLDYGVFESLREMKSLIERRLKGASLQMTSNSGRAASVRSNSSCRLSSSSAADAIGACRHLRSAPPCRS